MFNAYRTGMPVGKRFRAVPGRWRARAQRGPAGGQGVAVSSESLSSSRNAAMGIGGL